MPHRVRRGSLPRGAHNVVLFPPLSGQVVNETLNNINMTQAGMMAGYGTGSVIISTSTVHARAVKARVAKLGTVVHELAVLRLASSGVGRGPSAPTGRVAESGSLARHRLHAPREQAMGSQRTPKA